MSDPMKANGHLDNHNDSSSETTISTPSSDHVNLPSTLQQQEAGGMSLNADLHQEASDGDGRTEGQQIEQQDMDVPVDAATEDAPTQKDDLAKEPKLDGIRFETESEEVTDAQATWTLRITLPQRPTQVQDYHSTKYGCALNWKGLQWNILLRMQWTGDVGIFVGYLTVPAEEISNTPLPISLSFRVIDPIAGVELTPGAEKLTTAHTIMSLLGPADQGWDNLKSICRAPYKDGNAPLLDLLKSDTFHLVITLTDEVNPAPGRVDGHYNSKSSTGMVGLQNLGATCYLNSLLQMLYHINAFRRAVYRIPHVGESFASSTTLALQHVFLSMQASPKEVTTKSLLSAFGWSSQEAFNQQDVQEMMRILLDKLEEKMKGTVVGGEIKRLFCGTVRSFIKCVNVAYESKREEEFYDIQLDVKGCRNMDESFKKYVEKEMLDGENQYDAGVTHGKQDAEKGVIFTKLPPVLTLLLKRFDFDMQRMGFRKIHDHYEFPLRIDLDQYVAAEFRDPRSPNRYVLQSVLVHAGDVGGGHYYAYIRPSCGYDYGGNTWSTGEENVTLADVTSTWERELVNPHQLGFSESVNQRKRRVGKWYKFNDEVVSEVRDRDAVEGSYGRNSNELGTSFSSAYMLVYIHVNEAGEIMRDLRDEDVPADLRERLSMELEAKQLEDIKRQMSADHLIVNYYTEGDLKVFRDYSRTSNLFGRSTRYVKVLKSAITFRAFVEIAAELNVPLCGLRLWVVEKDARNGVVSVCYPLTIEDMRKPCKSNTLLFAEELEYEPKGDIVINCSMILQQYKDAFSPMLCRRVIDAISSINPGYSRIDPSWIDFYGLGCDNSLLLRAIPPESSDVYSQMVDVNDAASMMINDLTSLNVLSDQGKDDVIVFFKVFDAFDILSLEDEHDLRNSSPLKASTYCPVKYVGHFVCSRKQTVSSLYPLLMEKLSTNHTDLQLSPFQSSNHQLFQCMVPQNFSDISWYYKSDDQQNASISKVFERFTSSILLLLDADMDMIMERFGVHDELVPFSCNNFKEWVSFTHAKRQFTISPFSDFDIRVLQSNAQKFAAIQYSDSIVDSSVTGAKRKSVTQPTGDGVEDIAANGDDVDGRSVFETSPNRFVLQLELSGILTISRTIEYIGKSLGIAPQLIVLYSQETLDISSKGISPAQKPLLLNDTRSINAAFERKNFSSQNLRSGGIGHTATVNASYRILPFPLFDIGADNNVAVDQRSQYRHMDITIADAKTRNWRRHFLEHHLASAVEHKRLKAQYERTSSVEPIWPLLSTDIVLNEFRVASRLFVRLPKMKSLGSVMGLLRDEIGIPLNIDPFGGLLLTTPVVFGTEAQGNGDQVPIVSTSVETPMATADFKMADMDGGVSLGYGLDGSTSMEPKAPQSSPSIFGIGGKRPLNSSADSVTKAQQENEESGEGALVSLRGGKRIILPTLVQPSTPLIRGRQHDVITDVDTSSLQGLTDAATPPPAYPLALCRLRGNCIADVFLHSKSVNDLPTSWLDCQLHESSKILGAVTIQGISHEEVKYMRGEVPSVRSMIVTVFSFTLLGNGCIPCAADAAKSFEFLHPFLSYIREDDTYESLAARLASITGEPDTSNMRLAMVVNKTPTFFTRLSVADNGHTAGSTTTEGEIVSKEIWKAFSAAFPSFASLPFEQARAAVPAPQNFVSLKTNTKFQEYPQLGIQRQAATTSAAGQSQKSSNYRESAGIKIS